MAWMIIQYNDPESPISITLALLAIILNLLYSLYSLLRWGKGSLLDTLIIFISLPLVFLSLYFDTSAADSPTRKVFVVLVLMVPFALLS